MPPVTNEIFQVGGGGYTAPEDAAVYLIRLESDAALVDAGTGGDTDRLFRNIESCGVPTDAVRLLLLTHCHFDHTGGAAEVRDRTGCRIVAHALEAPFLEEGDDRVTAALWYGAHLSPLPIDEIVEGPEGTIRMGGREIRAIHIPGHSPGSMAFFMESDGQRVLFGQDIHGPLDESLLSDEEAYARSLEQLAGLDADILCEGHYGVFRGKEEVRGFIRSFLRA
ncbi:MAG: MBL fold metallo-hydrolase [Deltaproteobacteria bacterium]|nr:MBL fold metallo-hydrolase [Deltaproteobacteria bacterium]